MPDFEDHQGHDLLDVDEIMLQHAVHQGLDLRGIEISAAPDTVLVQRQFEPFLDFRLLKQVFDGGKKGGSQRSAISRSESSRYGDE